MPRPTTTSTTNAISTAAPCSNKTEPPPWPMASTRSLRVLNDRSYMSSTVSLTMPKCFSDGDPSSSSLEAIECPDYEHGYDTGIKSDADLIDDGVQWNTNLRDMS